MKKIKTALIQHQCSDDPKANIASTVSKIRDLASKGAELAVLQELHTSTYFCQQEDPALFDLAETIPGKTSDIFSKLAKELNLVLVTSLFEKRAAGIYHNTAVVFDVDGSIAGKYRKMHIPDDPGFYEKFYFTPGDMGFEPIQTSLGKLGVLICWDQWFPEAARLMALAGAELLIYPTAIGWNPSDDADEKTRQRDAWITSQRAHAIANGIPVIAVNRVGYETAIAQDAGIAFWGSSFVAGPQGEILFEASVDKEESAIVDIDMRRAENVRRIWPFFRDRRVDAYEDLKKIYLDDDEP
ncbi:MAG: carbon-nitrogen hydrolase [Agarilytica sp.]